MISDFNFIGFFLLISETPCKLTPGKQHHIFVPETPTGKNGRRKSDGTQVVKESPNIDALKRENGRTLTASLLVRSRSSFYSGDYFLTCYLTSALSELSWVMTLVV